MIDTKKIILCADDYAITPNVSLAIRNLIDNKRISATSVMMSSEFAEQELQLLAPYFENIDVGIHLTLTDQAALTPCNMSISNNKLPTFAALAKLAFSKTLPMDFIYAELESQITKFIDNTGRLPDYLDGHHHVHILPGIQDIVIELFQKHLNKARCYIRSCHDSIGNIFAKRNSLIKSLIINKALAWKQHKKLLKLGINTNLNFSGIYNLKTKKSYGETIAPMLKSAGHNTIIMCHPGYTDALLAEKDCMTCRRDEELGYLLSDAFLVALKKHHAFLGRFIDA